MVTKISLQISDGIHLRAPLIVLSYAKPWDGLADSVLRSVGSSGVGRFSRHDGAGSAAEFNTVATPVLDSGPLLIWGIT